jgi:hypothetical protein
LNRGTKAMGEKGGEEGKTEAIGREDGEGK